MTMTTTTTDQVASADVRFPTVAKVVLIGAPLLMAAGRALLVPLDDQEYDKTMSAMLAHETRSNTGWLLALAACGLLSVTAFLLARRVAEAGRRRAAWFATITTAMGWAVTACVCVAGLYMTVAAKAPDRAVQVQLQKDFNSSAAMGVMFLLAIGAMVGYIVLAVALAKASIVSKGAAVLIGLGGVSTIITMGGPVTLLLVLTALLLAAGHALAVRGS